MRRWLALMLGRWLGNSWYRAWVHEHRCALGWRDSAHSLEKVVEEKETALSDALAEVRELRARLFQRESDW